MSADSPDIAQQRMLARRAELLARYPDEFLHGYLSGNTGDPQKPCDAAGYPAGFHTWPLEQRNAWWAGWNLGAVERDA